MSQFIKDRLFSFSCAFKGLFDLFANHTHAKIHLFFVLVVSLLGFYLKINEMEWILVVICCAMVIGAEAFNTSIEYLCDKVNPEEDPVIAKVKDMSAGAVLVFSIGAFCIGLIIFFPKLISTLGF